MPLKVIASIVLIYYVLINVAAFLMYKSDKRRARNELWRIPENVLLTVAALGGAVGSLAAMKMFHHKTRKPKFRFGVPAMLILHCLLVLTAGGYVLFFR